MCVMTGVMCVTCVMCVMCVTCVMCVMCVMTGVMGPKEIAVLCMLEQGMDLVASHVGARVQRRLDCAMGRVLRLQTRLASLRQAVAPSFLPAQERSGRHEGHAAPEGRDDARGPRHLSLRAQGRQDWELEAKDDSTDLLHQTCKDPVPGRVSEAAADRVPLSAASANQMRKVEGAPVRSF